MSARDPLPLPKLSAPATRAVEGAGITDLRQLDGRPESELLALHGLGPAQLGVLRDALARYGLAMTDPVARPRATGRNDNQTSTSPEDPRSFLATVEPERRRLEGLRLLEIFDSATGERAVMWGPSMVGYGHHHYVYDSGREGDTFRVGFSPRKSALSLYGLLGAPGAPALLERLGPHRTGRGCLYVTNLSKVDESALAELVSAAWGAGGTDGGG